MSDPRYTICTYLRDLAKPSGALDFAVLVAAEKEVVLAGINLSAYGIEAANPFEAEVIENTFDVMFRRLRAACDSVSRPSGFAVLDNLVANNRSNFQFRKILDASQDGSILKIALELFASEIQGKVAEPAARQRSDGATWHESERIMEQWIKVGGDDADDDSLLCASSSSRR